MKLLKYTVLITALCAGISALAHADLTLVTTESLPNSGAATELAAFIAATGDTDATMCDKLDTSDPFPGGPVTQNGFTYTFGQNADGQFTVTVAFNLTGTGQLVCGFLVKDGGKNVNIYSVSEAEGARGSFTLLVPANSQQFGQLSHVDVFCCAGSSHVPDSGTTAMLLGGALTGLGALRRYLKH